MWAEGCGEEWEEWEEEGCEEEWEEEEWEEWEEWEQWEEEEWEERVRGEGRTGCKKGFGGMEPCKKIVASPPASSSEGIDIAK